MATDASCLAIINGEQVNDTISRFGQETGAIYVVDASDCWIAALADIDNQIALAESALSAFNLLHLDTSEVTLAIAEISSVREYATGSMIFSQWQWDHNDLNEDDQVGLCWYQDSGSRSQENAASCWAFTYTNGGYDQGYSYLVKPSKIGVATTLDSFDPVDPAIPAGTGGSWILKGPEDATETEKIAFGVRFSPSEGSNADPAVIAGTAEVVTYVSSRTAQTNASEEGTALLADGHFHLQQVTDNFSANIKWQSEQVDLNCWDEPSCNYVPPKKTGATAVTTVGAILAAFAALLTF